MNTELRLWMGEAIPECECGVAKRICYTFHIKCGLVDKRMMKRLETISCDFISWLEEFVRINGIQFPFVRVLFLILIHQIFTGGSGSTCGHTEGNPCIKQIRFMVERVFAREFAIEDAANDKHADCAGPERPSTDGTSKWADSGDSFTQQEQEASEDPRPAMSLAADYEEFVRPPEGPYMEILLPAASY